MNNENLVKYITSLHERETWQIIEDIKVQAPDSDVFRSERELVTDVVKQEVEKYLGNDNIDLQYQGENCKTIFHLAAEANDYLASFCTLLEHLKSKGTRIFDAMKAQDKEGHTPLSLLLIKYQSNSDHTDELEHLLRLVLDELRKQEDTLHSQKGQDAIREVLNIKDRTGLALIHRVALQGSSNILQLILEYGGNPNATVNKTFDTPLHMVASSELNSSTDHAKKISLLAEYGANFYTTNSWNMTPSRYARFLGHAEVATCLQRHEEQISTQKPSTALRVSSTNPTAANYPSI